ncbi:hypothetical protein BDV37DRAFT_265854 [Aspergillus pseudonomiae]|uniref:Uncharacterized protein n=1 Tax=Aspergillus pseudonomiae TaxID=1506151 RepID=A0A5N7CT09_9EURO|nr:uncharacterized protein BDV37DRAFT_265854 [Aspergillus pseudonomiae]KAE8397336.1 hypothetical protein BDV37DRAFT_265854 [Aspergillus pseudonomiae]
MNCRKHTTACSIDKETDQRRKAHLKHRLMELEEISDLLDGLLEILRDENRIGRSDLIGRLGGSKFLDTFYGSIWRKTSLRKAANESSSHTELRYFGDFPTDYHQPSDEIRKIFSPEAGNRAASVDKSRKEPLKSSNEGASTRKPPYVRLPMDMTNNRIWNSLCSSGLRPHLHRPQAKCHRRGIESPIRKQDKGGHHGAVFPQPQCLEPPLCLRERDLDVELLRKLSVKV